jgi:hypothetical protein
MKRIWANWLLFLIWMVWLTACLPKDQSGEISTGWLSQDEINQLAQDWLDENKQSNGNEYIPNENKIDLDGSQIMFFANLKEESSQQMLGLLYQLLDQTDFQQDVIVYYTLDITQVTHQEISKRSITELPTLLVLKEGSEMGRIAGSPTEDFEQQLIRYLQISADTQFG